MTIPAQDQLDSVELTDRLLELFGQRFGSLVSAPGVPQWRMMSQFHYLSDDEIMDCIALKEGKLRACPLDCRSIFAVVSIPSDSPYRQPVQLRSLIDYLGDLGLLARVYRSDASDAVQIYLPFAEPVDTDHFAELLSASLTVNGYLVSPATLIVHSTKLPFTLPLQREFSWLNDSFESKLNRADLPTVSAIAVFLKDMQVAASDPAAVYAQLNQEKNSLCPARDRHSLAIPESTDIMSTQTEVPAVQEQVEKAILPTIFELQNQQLMLFEPFGTKDVSALPKGRPKRGKRPRSSLPDSSEAGDLQLVESFPKLILAAQADEDTQKEVITEKA